MTQGPQVVRGSVTAPELSRRLDPIAAQLRRVATSPAGGEISPAAAELVPLAAHIVAGVAAVLNTLQDPQDTGRHNLQALRALGQRLVDAAGNALTELNP